MFVFVQLLVLLHMSKMCQRKGTFSCQKLIQILSEILSDTINIEHPLSKCQLPKVKNCRLAKWCKGILKDQFELFKLSLIVYHGIIALILLPRGWIFYYNIFKKLVLS